MVVFRMHRTFFVFLKCTIQGGSKVDVLLIAFLHLWLKFCKGIDKYWIVPVRKLFYFHHCGSNIYTFLAPAPERSGPFNTKNHCIVCVTRLPHKLCLCNRNPNFSLRLYHLKVFGSDSRHIKLLGRLLRAPANAIAFRQTLFSVRNPLLNPSALPHST